MKTADRFWLALAILVPLFMRDKRMRNKIKNLKEVNTVLNREHDTLTKIIPRSH